ncbi:MAG TPA: DNA recombination protein RmuC [Acholeplasma sp.]
MTGTEITLSIIVGVLLVGSIILVVLLLKKKPVEAGDLIQQGKSQQEVLSKIETLRLELQKELESFNSKSQLELQKELSVFKETVTTKVYENVNTLNEKVENRLKEGFTNTDSLVKSINERLAVIDSAQKNIEKLSSNVDELAFLLSDKKLRGIFGEGQLYQILANVFGENNKSMYETQKTLSNGAIADALLHGPTGVGDIAVDSKFPLENYLLMNNTEVSVDERTQAEKDFKANIKKHIDDISKKYIIKGETADQAIMFIPAEAIFAELHSKYPELINQAQEKHVWITSPTTLVYMSTLISVIALNVERDKSAKKMHDEVMKLIDDFRLFYTRFQKIKDNIQTLMKSTENAEKTLNRVNNKVAKIANVDFEKIEDVSEE